MFFIMKFFGIIEKFLVMLKGWCLKRIVKNMKIIVLCGLMIIFVFCGIIGVGNFGIFV